MSNTLPSLPAPRPLPVPCFVCGNPILPLDPLVLVYAYLPKVGHEDGSWGPGAAHLCGSCSVAIIDGIQLTREIRIAREHEAAAHEPLPTERDML